GEGVDFLYPSKEYKENKKKYCKNIVRRPGFNGYSEVAEQIYPSGEHPRIFFGCVKRLYVGRYMMFPTAPADWRDLKIFGAVNDAIVFENGFAMYPIERLNVHGARLLPPRIRPKGVSENAAWVGGAFWGEFYFEVIEKISSNPLILKAKKCEGFRLWYNPYDTPMKYFNARCGVSRKYILLGKVQPPKNKLISSDFLGEKVSQIITKYGVLESLNRFLHLCRKRKFDVTQSYYTMSRFFCDDFKHLLK
ncbi:MAG: hypothetical protein QF521_23710, partial [Alphaproteobacteria bacterium]|nr:hypothetical protein [Alphaproteobacteria bacterium]